MKHLMIPVLLAGSLVALSTMEAGAVVCARGVVRAGCVAAAVVTTAPVVAAQSKPRLLSRSSRPAAAAFRNDQDARCAEMDGCAD